MTRRNEIIRADATSLVAGALAVTASTGYQLDIEDLLGLTATEFAEKRRAGAIVLSIKVLSGNAITDGRIRYRFFSTTQAADEETPMASAAAATTGITVEEGEEILTYALDQFLVIYGDNANTKVAVTVVRQ